MTNLAVEVAGIKLKNPVLTASGCYGFGQEYNRLYDISRLGGIMTKGTTLEPRLGNPTPRLAETPAGILNSIGLQNPGIDRVIEEEIPWLRQFDVAIIANISGYSFDEFEEMATRLDGVPGVDALEINISCPNVKGGGMAFGTDPNTAALVVKRVRAKTKLPLIVKLSPNVTDITEIARAVESEGADAVSLINTILGMAIDIKNRRPVLANVLGGLSGPAVKPVAVRMVYQVSKAVKVPIIGMGGITSFEDAIEFMLAGASAVAIGAGNFVNPFTPLEVITGLEEWLDKEGIKDIRELVGALKA
ncbi:MAG: dihydroorotate dehydrogenase catalytic subunit [Clostridia bacterium]|jgi:dihydroorotate dehydrogenase (NAD+) catalytic subunit|nr:dihydroorotate dehydrogenase catalytic subunit [Clostridia bacterium]MDN5322438.1 dihydroorotate dehydrogenase catalytic subunit [Clostridia bacterium]